jgi:hypothetical protein
MSPGRARRPHHELISVPVRRVLSHPHRSSGVLTRVEEIQHSHFEFDVDNKAIVGVTDARVNGRDEGRHNPTLVHLE